MFSKFYIISFGLWRACSDESSSIDCLIYNDGCIPASSSWSNNNIYICDNDTFRLVPYSCEIGDLSGKYGKLIVSYDLLYEVYNDSDWELLYYDTYNDSDHSDDAVYNTTDFEFLTFEDWKDSIYSPNLHIIRSDKSFWEVGYEQLSLRNNAAPTTSLVINCGNGNHERIFC